MNHYIQLQTITIFYKYPNTNQKKTNNIRKLKWQNAKEDFGL